MPALRHGGVLSVGLLTLLWATAPPTFSVASHIVNVYVVVADKAGHPLPGLTKDAFELREDGVPRKVEHFSAGTGLPLSLGLLIDTSPSQQRTLPDERAAARAFLEHVLVPGDQAFVMRFDLEVEELQGLTGDLALLTQAVNRTQINVGEQSPPPGSPSPPLGAPVGQRAPAEPTAPAGTHLFDALYQASQTLRSSEVGRKVIVLVSDGIDQGSQVSRRMAMEEAEKADVILYAVIVADPAFYWTRNRGFAGEEALERLAHETGGRLITVKDAAESADALRRIAVDLRAHYELGFTPPADERAGAFHRIDVREVNGHDKVRTRRRYYAPVE